MKIANLHLQTLNLDTGVISINGKGDKERIIQICNKESLVILKAYKKQYADKIAGAGGYFLVTRFNSRLSDQSIRTIVKNMAEGAGITRRITPYTFRHLFATLLLEKMLTSNISSHCWVIALSLLHKFTPMSTGKSKNRYSGQSTRAGILACKKQMTNKG